jgi:hypothetical protein
MIGDAPSVGGPTGLGAATTRVAPQPLEERQRRPGERRGGQAPRGMLIGAPKGRRRLRALRNCGLRGDGPRARRSGPRPSLTLGAAASTIKPVWQDKDQQEDG